MSEVKKRTTIGGQALIEGILMRGPGKTAIVVRKPDGEMEEKIERLAQAAILPFGSCLFSGVWPDFGIL